MSEDEHEIGACDCTRCLGERLRIDEEVYRELEQLGWFRSE